MSSFSNEECPPVPRRSQRTGQAMVLVLSALVILLVLGAVSYFVMKRFNSGNSRWLAKLPTVNLDRLSERASSMVKGCVEAVELSPQDPEAWGILGRVYLAHQFSEPAVECFEVAWELDPENHKWPYSIVLASPDSERAFELCEKAIQLCEHNAIEIRCRLAELYFDAGDLKKSKEVLETVTGLAPDYPRANLMLARIYLNENELDQCVQLAESVIEVEPKRREALRLLSQAYFRLGESEKSGKYARQSEDPSAVDAAWEDRLYQEVLDLRRDVNRLVQEAMRLPPNRIRERIQVLRDAIAEEPHEPNWHGFLGQTLLKAREFKEAEKVLKEGVRLHPLSAILHYSLGLVYLNQKKVDAAIESLEQAVSIKPDYDQAKTDLGIAFREKKDFQKSIQAFQEAIAIFPGNLRAQLNLAVAYELAGEEAKAVEAYRQSLVLDSQSPDIHLLLGKLLSKSEATKPEARIHLETARELDPSIPGIQELLNAL